MAIRGHHVRMTGPPDTAQRVVEASSNVRSSVGRDHEVTNHADPNGMAARHVVEPGVRCSCLSISAAHDLYVLYIDHRLPTPGPGHGGPRLTCSAKKASARCQESAAAAGW